MKISKKALSNIVFVIIIGLLIYPPTKVYFIRFISIAPSTITKENQQKISNYNWSLKGLNTSSFNFEETKNKVVFISFWATWCPPCRAEMPSIQKLYNDYKDKATFILVSNEDWQTINTFYQKNNYNLPTYNVVSDVSEELKSASIPASFIIDKSGKIVVDKKGAANWNSDKTRVLLDKLLE